MKYVGKHTTREEKRRRQRIQGMVAGLSVLALTLCIGFAAGWLL